MRLTQRLPRIERPERTLEVLNGLVFAVTLLGGGILAFVGHVPRGIVILGGITLFGLYSWVNYSRRASTYEFVEDSSEFVEFFAKWYGKSGDHWIFCDDLDWISSTNAAKVRAALAERPEAVKIALRKLAGPAYEELRAKGVAFLEIDEALSTHAKFSIHHYDGFYRMILRNKPARGASDDRVLFRRVPDQFSITMALDIFNNNCAGPI
jgi:hypothetical protein